MTCAQYIQGNIDNAAGFQVYSQTAVNNALIASGMSCPDLIAALNPSFAEGNASSVIPVPDGTILTFADMIFSGTGGIRLYIEGVNFGFWTIIGGVVDSDNTTYGPSVTLGPVNYMSTESFGGIVNFTLPIPNAIKTFDSADYIACAIPGCGIAPPSPPFPPYLPPSPPWPTITPAPTPQTASFPPGQPANKVLGIGANYSIFSNFGYKG